MNLPYTFHEAGAKLSTYDRINKTLSRLIIKTRLPRCNPSSSLVRHDYLLQIELDFKTNSPSFSVTRDHLFMKAISFFVLNEAEAHSLLVFNTTTFIANSRY